jgi:hypothetical protein
MTLSTIELFYSYGGHGGPYDSVQEAERWARMLLKGDPNLHWVDIRSSSTALPGNVIKRIERETP